MSETASVGWAIVGPGAIARTFADSLRRYRAGRLVQVLGRSPERTAAFCRQAGGMPATALRELLIDPTVQAVYVATPHPCHFETALRCLDAGKAVLCEKPMTVQPGDTETLVAASRRNRVPLVEAWMYRTHPQIARLLQIVRGGELGRPLTLTASFCFSAPYDPESRLYHPAQGGGAILDVGGYPVSLALAVAAARSGQLQEPELGNVQGERAPSGVDQHASATLSFGDFTARVTTSISRALGSTAEIQFEHGKVTLPTPFLVDGMRHGTKALLRIEKTGEPAVAEPHIAGVDCFAAEAQEMALLLASPLRPVEASPPMVGHAESLLIGRLLAAWARQLG